MDWRDIPNFKNVRCTGTHMDEYKKVRSMLEDPKFDQSLDCLLVSKLLHDATEQGNALVILYLFNKGCDPDMRDSRGRTPLMVAVEKTHSQLVQILLIVGASLLAVDHENKSVLQILLSMRNRIGSSTKYALPYLRQECSSSEEAAQKLIDAGYQIDLAVYVRDVKILEYMLERGFSADSTALRNAVALKDVECVRILLKYGAPAENDKNYSPLYYVPFDESGFNTIDGRSSEKFEILRLLFSHGVSPMSRNHCNEFQIKHTLMYGDSKSIRLILPLWDFSAKDGEEGTCLLHHLAVNCNPGVVDELAPYSEKFNVDTLDDEGKSPLHMTAWNGNVEMAKFLLDNGAEVDRAELKHARTPLYFAYAEFLDNFKRCLRCIELLLMRGADPRVVDNESTIFEAARRGFCPTDALLKPVIARLAMLEEFGATIADAIREGIDSKPRYREYFDRCRRVLRWEIDGTVTILNLLTDSEKRLGKYASDKRLMLKLHRIGEKYRVKTSFSYYRNALIERFSKGREFKRLRRAAAEGICEIFGDRIDRAHVVVCKVTDYLNEPDLRQLCKL